MPLHSYSVYFRGWVLSKTHSWTHGIKEYRVTSTIDIYNMYIYGSIDKHRLIIAWLLFICLIYFYVVRLTFLSLAILVGEVWNLEIRSRIGFCHKLLRKYGIYQEKTYKETQDEILVFIFIKTSCTYTAFERVWFTQKSSLKIKTVIFYLQMRVSK